MRCYHCTRSIKHIWLYLFRDLYIAAKRYLSNIHTHTQTHTFSFSLSLSLYTVHFEYPSKWLQLVPYETTAVSVQVLCTPYNHAPVYSVILFEVHVCSAVTCYLHFWQNGQDLLCVTAVTQGWNGSWMSQHRKFILGERILLLLLLSPCVFNCNLPPARLAEWPGSFMCYSSNTGPEWIPNKSAQKVDSGGKEFCCYSCWDSNPKDLSLSPSRTGTNHTYANLLRLFYLCWQPPG